MTRFTLVSAIFNVARYLPDFLESLDRQDFDHSRVQVVLVDDGSTDESGELVDDWATDFDVTVIHQANAGQGAARNAGLKAARGEWISFPDPDDILDPEYLSQVHESLEQSAEATMAVTHLLDYWESTGEIKDSHPMRFRFSGGSQAIDLDRFPRNIQLSAATAFFRRQSIVEQSLKFDSRVRPVYEDAHFVQHYLLPQDVRLVNFCAEAFYMYRRRSSGDSTLQLSGVNPARYTDVLEFGLLDLLACASERGPIPRWLQYAVLYDLFWVLRSEDSLTPKTGAMSATTAERFEALLRSIRAHLSAEAIRAFDVIQVSSAQREVLLHGASDQDWHWEHVQISDFDESRGLMKLTYRFAGRQPHEEIWFRGLKKEPMFAKTRSHRYLGRALLNERHLWVSSRGTIEIRLNGRLTPLRFTGPGNEQFYVRPATVAKKFVRTVAVRPGGSRRRKVTADDRLTSLLADSRPFKEKFEGAWIFMDRSSAANDNAEHLFKYIRHHHPQQNIWFVIDKESADWSRLKAEGIDRLIPHGSRLWKVACLNAERLISSHIDLDVVRPFRLSNGRTPSWDYAFLQHGVIKDDLSSWLNGKSPSVILTSTEPEHRSIVGDGSSYKFCGKEVVLTGLPRFDRLVELDTDRRHEDSRFITVFPTWRKSLDPLSSQVQDDQESTRMFRGTAFARNWSSLLSSPQLRQIADSKNLRIRFMPHPNLRPFLECFDVPEGVEVVSYADQDVQNAIADSEVVVTDFSSIAFDAAFIDRQVLYFQFDQDSVFGGAHITRPGYFSYEKDGFGPVTTSPEEALIALAQLVSGTHPDIAEFAERRKRTFTLPRTGNCERAYAAILETMRRVAPTEGTTLHPTPQAQPTRYLREASEARGADRATQLAVMSDPEPVTPPVSGRKENVA